MFNPFSSGSYKPTIFILLLSIIYPRREFNLSEFHIHHLDNNRSCTQRPVLDYSILSPSEQFIIHYNDYYDGIEDYAYNVALSADSSRKVIVDMMNFRSEVPDEDSIYDIYINYLQIPRKSSSIDKISIWSTNGWCNRKFNRQV